MATHEGRYCIYMYVLFFPVTRGLARARFRTAGLALQGTDLGDNGAVLAGRRTGRGLNRSRVIGYGAGRSSVRSTGSRTASSCVFLRVFIASRQVVPSRLVSTTQAIENDVTLGLFASGPLQAVAAQQEVRENRLARAETAALLAYDPGDAYLAAAPVTAGEYARGPRRRIRRLLQVGRVPG